MYWFYFISSWIFLGIICSIIARRKNRSVAAWLVLGILFGIFALISIACLPSVQTSEEAFEEAQTKMNKQSIDKESSTIDDGLEDLW